MSSSTIVDRPLDAAISDALTDLALDLRWSFNHSADQLWEQLDPELWELTHNPWVLLQTVSREKLQNVTSNPRFQRLLADLRREKTRKRGFKRRIRVRACRQLRISRWNSC
jgi:glucan phosphorylase